MDYPDLTTKIKIKNKHLLTEKETICKEKRNIEEERISKKYRDRLSEGIAILLSKSEKEKLEEIANQEERSLSYMARKAIKQTYKI